MANELILSTDGRLGLPDKINPHAAMLLERQTFQRLVPMVPAGSDRLAVLAAIAVEANKRELVGCTPRSVAIAGLNCAMLGLSPGGILGMAHFIPYGKICQLVIGYKGWTDLAWRGRFLSQLFVEVVLRGEKYRRWNDENDQHMHHELPPDRDKQLTWENVLGAYCVWRPRGGKTSTSYVGRDDPKGLAYFYNRAGADSTWKTDTIAMCLKTPILRASKLWHRTPEIGYAHAMEDAIDMDAPQPASTRRP